MICIYRLQFPNKMRYIGQAANLKNRLYNHELKAKKTITPLNKAIRKYGLKDEYVKILEYCNVSDANKKEKQFILKYKSNNKKYGYNINLAGTGRRDTY